MQAATLYTASVIIYQSTLRHILPLPQKKVHLLQHRYENLSVFVSGGKCYDLFYALFKQIIVKCCLCYKLCFFPHFLSRSFRIHMLQPDLRHCNILLTLSGWEYH